MQKVCAAIGFGERIGKFLYLQCDFEGCRVVEPSTDNNTIADVAVAFRQSFRMSLFIGEGLSHQIRCPSPACR